jgi:hypothetical protein
VSNWEEEGLIPILRVRAAIVEMLGLRGVCEKCFWEVLVLADGRRGLCFTAKTSVG